MYMLMRNIIMPMCMRHHVVKCRHSKVHYALYTLYIHNVYDVYIVGHLPNILARSYVNTYAWLTCIVCGYVYIVI